MQNFNVAPPTFLDPRLGQLVVKGRDVEVSDEPVMSQAERELQEVLMRSLYEK